MAWPTSDFPTSIDTITDMTDSVDDVDAADINGAYDCIEKLEAKVGIDSSGVATSLDYLLNNSASLDPGHKHSFASGMSTIGASLAIVTSAGGLLVVSAVTATELGYLSGVTSGIQTQIDNAGSVDISGTPVLNDFARFTDADTLEGRSYAEVRSDLSLVIGTNVLAEQTIGIANDNLLEVDGAPNSAEYAKFTAAGLEGRTFAEMRVDLDLEAGIDFYSKTAEDTWRNSVTQTEMGYLDGVTSDIQTQIDAKLANVSEDSTPQLGGNLDLNEKGVSYDFASLASDHTYSGDVFTATAGENLVIGDVCYLKSDGSFWKTDANVEAEIKGLTVMATGTINAAASGVFLIRGLIRDDTWAWTVGAALWASETAGNPTETQPADAGDFVKLVGWAKSATYVWFDPDKSYGKVA